MTHFRAWPASAASSSAGSQALATSRRSSCRLRPGIPTRSGSWRSQSAVCRSPVKPTSGSCDRRSMPPTSGCSASRTRRLPSSSSPGGDGRASGFLSWRVAPGLRSPQRGGHQANGSSGSGRSPPPACPYMTSRLFRLTGLSAGRCWSSRPKRRLSYRRAQRYGARRQAAWSSTPGPPVTAYQPSTGAAGMTPTVGGEFSGAGLAVMSNRFEGIVRAMRNTLVRSSRSGVVNVARDFSCSVVSSGHEVLHWAESLPIHVLSCPDLMARSMVELHPRLRRGDAFLHNSPYHGGLHAADHAIIVPVMDDEGLHRFTVVAASHQADCGNAIPTTYAAQARDVHEEGALIFPCVQAQRDYKHNEDL